MFNIRKMKLKRFVSFALAFIMTFGMLTNTVFAYPSLLNPNKYSVYKNDPSTVAGEMVNVINGNYVNENIDLEMYGTQPLKLIRTYNVMNAIASDLGIGWRHNYMYSLADNGSSVTVTMPDGVGIVFTKNGDIYSAPDGVDMHLEKQSDGYVMTSYANNRYIFDNDGKLLQIIDIKDRATNFAYNVELLESVSNNTGSLTFAYTDDMLVSVTDSIGKTASYSYSADGELISFQNYDGKTISYTYENNLLTQVSDYS